MEMWYERDDALGLESDADEAARVTGQTATVTVAPLAVGETRERLDARTELVTQNGRVTLWIDTADGCAGYSGKGATRAEAMAYYHKIQAGEVEP